MKRGAILLASLLMLFSILNVTGCGTNSSKSPEMTSPPVTVATTIPIVTATPTATPTINPTPIVTPQLQIINVTAMELYSAYSANELAADAQYRGKVLNVTGTIADIDRDPLSDNPEIVLGGELIMGHWMGVRAIFDKEYESELAKLVKGTIVTVQGEIDHYHVNIDLKNCRLVQ